MFWVQLADYTTDLGDRWLCAGQIKYKYDSNTAAILIVVYFKVLYSCFVPQTLKNKGQTNKCRNTLSK